MASCRLFHGPCAFDQAQSYASQVGLPISEPVGGDKLKTDQAREAVSQLLMVAVGDRRGTLVIGPMDQATVSASDVLLKSVEYVPPRATLPVLWARSLAGVAPTIVSRCEAVWSPGEEDIPQFELIEALYSASDRDDPADLLRVLGEMGGWADVVSGLARVCRGRDGTKVWSRVRWIMDQQQVTRLALFSALTGCHER